MGIILRDYIFNHLHLKRSFKTLVKCQLPFSKELIFDGRVDILWVGYGLLGFFHVVLDYLRQFWCIPSGGQGSFLQGLSSPCFPILILFCIDILVDKSVTAFQLKSCIWKSVDGNSVWGE